MPRQIRETEGKEIEGTCKIRKRGCSSSSSSSLVRKYRFKRAILVGKRFGSGTPVPTWKLGMKSPPLEMQNGEFYRMTSCNKNGGGKGTSSREMTAAMAVSARKLAATLWETNGVHSPPAKAKKNLDDKKELRSREKDSQSGSLPPYLSDPFHSPVSEGIDRSRGGGGHRRRSSAAISQKLQLTEYNNLGRLDSVSNASLMEVETKPRGETPSGHIVGIKTRLKDVSNGLITSKELLKVLNRVWGLEDHHHQQHHHHPHSSTTSLVSALKLELDRARVQVDQLIQDQRCNRNEINHVMKRFAEEKEAWKSKERERIRESISSIAAELEVEKKLRRQSERLNKKLGKELADTKAHLSKALKELESEKRARDILEQVCDELASGIGEDRAEVEVMKRESEKVREEVEKEREMLHLADVLREERVQMKLSEAKYHFEEKNAAVDKLKSELEAYLRNKASKEDGEDGSPPQSGRSEELRIFLRKVGLGSHQNGGGIKVLDQGEVEDGEEHEEEEDSGESDLHSIELNMDSNSRSYAWNFDCGDGDAAAQDDDSKRSSVEVFKGRKSLSEKIQWGSICLKRGTSDGVACESGTNCHENSDGTDKGRFSDVASLARRKDNEDETKKYRSVKSLRDHISKLASVQGFASPTRQWGQSLPMQDPGSVWESPRVLLTGSTLKTRPAAGIRSEHKTSTPKQ